MKKNKVFTDIVAAASVTAALATGFMLHSEVHHRYIYDDTALWTIHEICGLAFAAAVACHCLQHRQWFDNYARIPVKRKRVTTILLILGAVVVATGIVLMCGSQSHAVSIVHYATAILFTLLSIGHVAKRWRIFKALLAVGRSR